MRDRAINDTSTTMFLVPGLGFSVLELRQIHGFINAYLQDSTREHLYDFSVYLLFRPLDDGFDEFVRQQYSRPEFIEDYDYEGGFVVLVYRFPDKYEQEFKYFLKGKFSRFRKNYQALFPRFAAHTIGHPLPELSLELMICGKVESLRNLLEERLGVVLDETNEVWPVPSMKKETLDERKAQMYLSNLK